MAASEKTLCFMTPFNARLQSMSRWSWPDSPRLPASALSMTLPPGSTGFMNVHHLELFYYVARHGGIMPAVRNIPYGIQQPAVSDQVALLEEFLGVTLIQQRPFA